MRSIDNLEIYLKNIPGPSACGKDIKYESVYDDIQEASREELDLPQGVWVKELKAPNWKKVENLGTDILTQQSKDFQVTAWLIKAWMYLYQMEGLERGFSLLLQLSQKFWESAYPQLEPKDPEYRSAPYNWINEKLTDHLNQIPITHPLDKDGQVYAFATYIDTHYMADAKPLAAQQATDLEKKALDLKTSIKKTDLKFFEDLDQSIKNAKSIIQKLQTFLDEKMDKGSPSLYRIQEKLDQFQQYTSFVLSEKKSEAEKLVQKDTKDTTETIQLKPIQSEKASSLDDVIHSRAEAYAIIEKAADYLTKLDPHSPAPYLIKRAVRWGNLPFEDLIKEMVGDQNTQTELRRLLGVGTTPGGNFIAKTTTTGSGSSTNPPTKDPQKPFWNIEE